MQTDQFSQYIYSKSHPSGALMNRMIHMWGIVSVNGHVLRILP